MMKAHSIATAPNRPKGLLRATARAGSASDRGPAAARNRRGPREQTICRGCGVVFSHKTWRLSAHRLEHAEQDGAVWGSCPACLAVTSGQAFGRVRLEGSYVAGHETEIRRRIDNVAERAAFTQPERRLLDVVWRGAALEIVTTSQKLAHRIARELAKAFKGTVTYHWSDADGRLLATWRRDEKPVRRLR